MMMPTIKIIDFGTAKLMQEVDLETEKLMK
jgi:hypothetical protein